MTGTITRLYGWDCGQAMVPTADWTYAAPTADATYKKTGTYALKLTHSSGGCIARFPFAAAVNNPAFSLWLYMSTYYGAYTMQLRVLLSTGQYIDLKWDSTNHTFDAYVDNVKVADGSVYVNTNTWFHVQFYSVIDDSGSIKVKIDGRESINYLGDTQPGVLATAEYIYIYTVSLNYGTCYADDLAIGYGDYLGDIRCIDIRPNADTAVDNWIPSTGDNYSTIDESSTSTTTIDNDYNQTNTNAQADELDLSDFDGATYTPWGVTAWVRAQMLAATGDSIKVGIDSAGTDEVTTHALSTTWQYYFHTAAINPADSAAWEDADIDALKLRYESVIS